MRYVAPSQLVLLVQTPQAIYEFVAVGRPMSGDTVKIIREVVETFRLDGDAP